MSAHNNKPAEESRMQGRTAGSVLLSILKILGMIALVAFTTALIFVCILTIYVKTNVSSNLDISLEDFTLDESSIVYYKDTGNNDYKELVTLQSSQYRKWVDFKDIPVNMQHAVVAIEDKRFYTHHGVDWYRTAGAFVNMFLGMRDTFGGSTITQQLIKNLTQEDQVTVKRKLIEILRAMELEKKYSKNDILEWYLNVVYFGNGCYGIGAASEYYYNKDVKDLSLAECAALIGITNNPSLYSPFVSLQNNKERQENVLYEMYEQKYIDKSTYESAANEKLVFSRSADESYTAPVYTWYEDAIIEDVIGDLSREKGCSYKIAEQLLFTGGYRIYSTIDMGIQGKVDSVYQDLSDIPKTTGSKQQLESSIVVVDPYTGNILAMEGGVGTKTGNRLYNRATQSERPPGSSIKPLSVYGPALDLGLISPDTRFNDSPDVRLKGTSWMPNNDDFTYSGNVTVRTALIKSINTVSAQVLDKLTPSVSYKFLKDKLGFTTLSPNDKNYAPLALGQLTYGATVREMATAYCIFPNNGVYTFSRTYTKICDSKGNTVYDNVPSSNMAVSDVTAYWITSMLQDAVAYGTGYEAKLSGMPTAGKTGTTTDKKDRWFCGYTPYYVAAVWTGYDTPEVIHVNGNPAAQLWNKVMSLIHKDLSYKTFSTPASTYITPVPGVNDEKSVSYTVKGVTDDGKVLYENTLSGADGKTITVSATDVPGYEATGDTSKTLTLSDDSSQNAVVFTYHASGTQPSASPGTQASPSGQTSASPSGSTAPVVSPPATSETGGQSGGDNSQG